MATTTTRIAAPSTNTAIAPPSGRVVYQADWSDGLAGWLGSSADWSVRNGALMNDASGSFLPSSVIESPFALTIPNYAIETEVQVLSYKANLHTDPGFGIVVRQERATSYQAAVDVWKDRYTDHRYALITRNWTDINNELVGAIVGQRFSTGAGWHVYRVEMYGGTMNFLVDQQHYCAAAVNRGSGPDYPGLWSDSTQFLARSFRVVAL